MNIRKVLAAVLPAALLCAGASATAATIGVILPGSYPSTAQAEELQLGMTLALKTWPGDAAPKLVIKDSDCDARRPTRSPRNSSRPRWTWCWATGARSTPAPTR